MFTRNLIEIQAPGLISTPWRLYIWGDFLTNEQAMSFFKDNQEASVSASRSHCLILNKEGKAFSFGNNNDGQLGTGDNLAQAVPVPVQTELRFQKAVAGFAHSLFLSSDNLVYGCGLNSSGQVAKSEKTFHQTLQPILVPGLKNNEKVIDIRTGNTHSIGLTNEGRVFTWGSNVHGQLGLGHKNPNGVPQEVILLNNIFITRIVAHGSSSFCIDDKGIAYAWGRNDNFQLGLGNDKVYLIPTQITLPKDFKVKTIESGYAHTVALGRDGRVLTFGNTTKGQCGLVGELGLVEDTIFAKDVAVVKDPTIISIPEEIVQSIFVGYDYSLFLTDKFNLYGCGNGTNGYLGESNKSNEKIINLVKIGKFEEIIKKDFYEIKKNVRKLFLVSQPKQTNPTFFSWLPRDVLVKIAGYTGGNAAVQDEKGSIKIASTFFKAIDELLAKINTQEDKKNETNSPSLSEILEILANINTQADQKNEINPPSITYP